MFKFWVKKTAVSYSLLPVSLLYSFISKINIILRARSSYKSKSFVISVGNINVGGTGKTPLTIAIAKYLHAEGKSVAIIGHGYKAAIENSEVVNEGFGVEKIGDEATQMLQMLPEDIMLIVGKNRLDSVKLAEEKNADVIILDDGYSATYIDRDVNIVVIDGKVQLGNQLIMPAGPLREPMSGLDRSDCMVIINRHRKLDFDYGDSKFYLKTKIAYSNKLNTKSLYAFCGLGVPSKFYNSLNKEGLGIKETKSFSDHYSYKDHDIDLLISKAKTNNLQLVTTFKDMVKINSKYKEYIETVELKLELTKSFKLFLDQKIIDFVNKN